MFDGDRINELLQHVRDLQIQVASYSTEDLTSTWLSSMEERQESERAMRNALAQLGGILVDALAHGEQDEVFDALESGWEALDDEVADGTGALSRFRGGGREGGASGVRLDPAPNFEARNVARIGGGYPVGIPTMLTPEMLSRLQRSLDRSPGPSRSHSPSNSRTMTDEDRIVIQASLDILGPTPDHLRAHRQQMAELEAVEEVLDRYLDRWGALPRRTNHSLTSWITARVRVLQEAVGNRKGDEDLRRRIDMIFPRLSAHAKDSQPGTVHGLARDHGPREGSWFDDALGYEDRMRSQFSPPSDDDVAEGPSQDDLLRMLNRDVKRGLPLVEFARRAALLLQSGISADEPRLVNLALDYELEHIDDDRLLPLRKAVRARRDEDESQQKSRGDDENPSLPRDWPWRIHLQDKRVVIVGGDARPERMKELQEVFGFSNAEWIENISSNPRKLDALLARLQSGLVDTVIVLRAWSNHTLTDRLFPLRADGHDILLAEGYGVNQIRLSVERFHSSEPVPTM